MAGTFNQLRLDTLRGMNNAGSGAVYDPNMPIPRPGQPTNYQLPPLLGSMGSYVNQDVNGFNAPQTIPGTFNGRPVPQSPTSTSVTIPGYGSVPVGYGGGLSDQSFYGSEPQNGVSAMWRQLVPGLLSNSTAQGMTPELAQSLVPGQQPIAPPQSATNMPGAYGRQAMQMAGLRGPDSYPNGLLGGGKGGFRPGGK
jgi:hypothetical protein